MPSTLDDYTVLETIGTGTYGKCRKICRKRDSRILVWKEMTYGNMSEVEKQLLVSEVNVLRELRHRNIVRYYDRIIDRNNSTLYLIMEYCQCGDLATLIEKNRKDGRMVEEAFAWKIATQIISALKECHSNVGKTILHRDLKPANVFLDSNMNVKLGDFGLARVLQHDTSFAQTFVGTPYYMSPEQMNNMSYNEKCDIWSLGCLLYELCALKPPFTAINQRELSAKITHGKFVRIPYCFSDELNSLIACMIRVDERKRPTIDDLYEHPVIITYLQELESVPAMKSSGSAPPSPSESGTSLEEEYAYKMELLAKKEILLDETEKRLKDLEQRLRLKEMTLEEREKKLSVREKFVDERLLQPSKLRHLSLLSAYKGKPFY